MAQVTLDGTANPSFEGPLDGPDYQIGAELGRRAGRNLFHSFERFGLRTGESATFSGPDAIRNVISRVTGGARSDIDGTLRSTIPGADFYFLNPAGVMFGANARLDLQGSFHVSTADELRFADGATFSATNRAASSFTVAPPEAFGFLAADPGAITVDRSTLEVPAGEAFSIVGGDITINGGNNGAASDGDDGTVRAEAGQITLAAVGAEGRLTVATGELEAESRRDISLTDQAFVDATGNGGGTIRIRGGQIIADRDVQVFANNNGVRNGRDGLDIDAEVLRVRRGSGLTADALDEGTGGDVVVRAGTLEVSGDSQLAANTFAQDTDGEGDAGTVTVRANDVVLRRSSIRSSTSDEGAAGAVTVVAGNLVARDSIISSDTFGAGDAGTVTVRANDVVLRGTSISSDTSESAAGAVTVVAGNLVARDSIISSDTFGAGDAGTVTVRANDVVLRGTSISSDTSESAAGAGDAGTVTVVTGNLVARGSGISTNTFFGAGDAGTVTVRANDVVLR